jgi:hypothetical protein
MPELKPFNVEVTETLQRTVQVKAVDPSHAVGIVEDMYRDEKIVLSSDDHVDTTIEIASDVSDSNSPKDESNDVTKALNIIVEKKLNVGAFMLLCKSNHEYTPNTTYDQYVYFCEHEDSIGGDKMHSFACYRLSKDEYELVLNVLYSLHSNFFSKK